MHDDRQKSGRHRTGNKTGIWLTLSIALGLHAIILFLPIAGQIPVSDTHHSSIELQLTTISLPAPVPPVEYPEPEVPPPEPEPETAAEHPEVALEKTTQAEVERVTEKPPPPARLVARTWQRDLDSLSEPEKAQLTNTILSRQFFTEESAADQLFGKLLHQPATELYKDFHYPLRPDLISMLDKPVPDVPFAYTPGLVYFAYEPGVKGDLQRFWDVITPEFGWRTKYGTEVRCVLVLVLIGCGWK